MTVGCLIAADDRGLATLELAGPGGAARSYAFCAAPRGLGAWAVDVRALDTEKAYRVEVSREGLWRCRCPDYRHRGPRGARGCKHCEAARGLYALRRLLLTQEEQAHDQ